jgi:hypothetical protein
MSMQIVSGSMSQDIERRKLLERIMFAAQKARSIQFETWGEDDVEVLLSYGVLDSVLFDEPTLVESIERVLAKSIVEPIDVYNILFLAHRSKMLVQYCTMMNVALPEPTSAFQNT